jgi:FKBP-type peptidyl-prolyl cis-trans isomerase
MALIFGKPKKRAKPQGNPPWLTWSVTLLIAYMLFNHYTEKKKQPAISEKETVATEQVQLDTSTTKPENKPTPTTAAQKEEPIKDATPALPTGVTIGGDIAGHGHMAECGMEMVLLVDTSFPEASERKGEIKKEMRVRAGITDTAPWVAALDGMKIGGVRQINMPAEMAVDASELNTTLSANDVVQYKVELQQLIPAIPQDELSYYKQDITEGTGESGICGSKAAFHLVLWGRNGKALYDSMKVEGKAEAIPLTTNIGHGEYFYGIDATLLGMKEGGARFAVIPPAYVSLGEKAEGWKKYLPAGHYGVLEVRLIDIEN